MENNLVISILVLVFSVVVHEVSHGYAAYLLGDPTAKYAGRLTLNPLKHLDPLGSFLVPLLLIISNAGVIFGWAKPVPYNPYNLRDQKKGPALVGLAGPLSNLVLALLAAVFIRAFLVFGVLMDGLAVQFFLTVILINILLLVFNMLPIPPLDGSKLLFAILPVSEHTKMMLEQYGFIFLFIFLILFGHYLGVLVYFILDIFVKIFVGVGASALF